jgi:hypothetical protein
MNNAQFFQLIGAHQRRAAQGLAGMVGGIDADTTMPLASDKQLVFMRRRPMLILRRGDVQGGRMITDRAHRCRAR